VLPRYSLTSSGLTEIFRGAWVAPVSEILDLSMRCGWTVTHPACHLVPSDRGREIIEEKDFQTRLRMQLADYVYSFRPPWSMLIPKGRTETLSCLDVDSLQCFREAGLAAPAPTPDIVRWWDSLAMHSRGRKADILLEIGRKGEQLSIRYEARRTGKTPKWQAIESNLSGYDLISIVSAENPSPLLVEVKGTTEDVEKGSFHLSRNEWDVACATRSYCFHIWAKLDSENPVLAVLAHTEVESHVPLDAGEGAWREVLIPYAPFTSIFTQNFGRQN
jgi:hypothetical protein